MLISTPVEDHAVDVQKDAGAKPDVEPIVAMKGWPNIGAFANGSKAFEQQLSPFCG